MALREAGRRLTPRLILALELDTGKDISGSICIAPVVADELVLDTSTFAEEDMSSVSEASTAES